MPPCRIKLDPEQLRQMAEKLKNSATTTQGWTSQLSNSYQSLDWEFTNKGLVDLLVTQAEKQRLLVSNELTKMCQYLQTAAIRLGDADKSGVHISTISHVPFFSTISPIKNDIIGIGAVSIPITLGLPWINKCIGSMDLINKMVQKTIEQQEWTQKIGKQLADFESDYYKKLNAFKDYGQCTWYCFGRVQEKLGITMSFDVIKGMNRNAKNWLELANVNHKSFDPQAAHANSIAVSYEPSPYGHVMFIENVIDGMVYFTEANWDKEILNENPETDGILSCMSIEEFILKRKIAGYIYP